MFDHHLLPPEIWLEILRWAATSDKEHELITDRYAPFLLANTDHSDPVIAVKRTLVLVCRKWNQLTTEFLYENIRITGGMHLLRDVLDRDRLGILVRRVVLPYSSTVTTYPHSITSIDVLRQCTNVRTLVRPHLTLSDAIDEVISEALGFHFDAQKVPLLSLRRLDWWYHHEAERTGGINSLNVVLHSAPNLRYLSIGGVVGYGPSRREPSPPSLPQLQTLRLHWSNGLFLRQLVDSWSLPALSHVIVDYPLADLWLNRLWETFGEQLTIVEFGRHVRFLIADDITPCLRNCRNLTELNYFLFFTAVPSIETHHTSITTVGLHASVNELLKDGGKVYEHIQQHFNVLMNRDIFPVLKNVLLYGEWGAILSHPHLASIWQALADRHIAFKALD